MTGDNSDRDGERTDPDPAEFHARFGPGAGGNDIAAGDSDCATVATVQRLAERVDRQEAALAWQREVIDEQRDDIEIPRQRIETLQTELARLRRD